jgi:propionate CoA-transferase
VARDLATMDPRIFGPGLMRLADDVLRKPRGYRSPRVARWHEARNAGGRP